MNHRARQNHSLLLFFAFLFLIQTGCSRGETQIYELKDLSTFKELDGKLSINEVFIISNPPKDKEDLLALVRTFNNHQLARDSAERKQLSRMRTFYRETRDLNKNFKEKNPGNESYFSKVDLSGYYEDRIVQSIWEVNRRISGSYMLFEEGTHETSSSFTYDLQ